MVEYRENLDTLFRALSDGTRRDILRRVSQEDLSIGALACHYEMSFAGIAKHVALLEKAGLVSKEKQGREQWVRLVPRQVEKARRHLKKYEELWENRFRVLDTLLNNQ